MFGKLILMEINDRVKHVNIKIKQYNIKNYLFLLIANFLLHGFILIASGRWWDDWAFINESDYALHKFAFDIGRPSIYFLFKFFKIFPEHFYRIVVFIMFYYCSISFFKILTYFINLNEKFSIWLTIFFICTPVNAERIMFIILPYTVGLFFFMIASDIFLNYFLESRKLFLRIISLVIFCLSFTLNSLLFFYGIILLMVLYKYKNFNCLTGLIDFILLPIIFYLLKTQLFATGGLYANYNSISIISLIKAIWFSMPFSVIETCEILMNLFIDNKVCFVVVFSILSITVIVLEWKNIVSVFRSSINKKQINSFYKLNAVDSFDIKKCIILLTIGFFVICIALFPYIAVRNSIIDTGRDAMLVPFGFSVVAFSVINILFNKHSIKWAYLTLLFLSIFYFNQTYLKYQNNFYRMVSFQESIKENDFMQDYNTALYITNEIPNLNLTRFYTLSAAYNEVTGKQDKFFLASTNDFYYFGEDGGKLLKQVVDSKNYHMDDYNTEYKKLDTIILHKFDSSLLSTVKLKFYEIFNYDKFLSEIKELTYLELYHSDTQEYKNIISSNGDYRIICEYLQ